MRLQGGHDTAFSTTFYGTGSYFRGILTPVVTLGALNAILFVSYHQSAKLLSPIIDGATNQQSLKTVFASGTLAGLAPFVLSTPSELIKCRMQSIDVNSSKYHKEMSSWSMFRNILQTEGILGLYRGGCITVVRDSIGYGFYFWGYEGAKKIFEQWSFSENASILLAGGVAGCISWTSIFPLDVIKTRIQIMTGAKYNCSAESLPLLQSKTNVRVNYRSIIGSIINEASPWRTLTSGLAVTNIRAFLVNAVTFYGYEATLKFLSTL